MTQTEDQRVENLYCIKDALFCLWHLKNAVRGGIFLNTLRFTWSGGWVRLIAQKSLLLWSFQKNLSAEAPCQATKSE